MRAQKMCTKVNQQKEERPMEGINVKRFNFARFSKQLRSKFAATSVQVCEVQTSHGNIFRAYGMPIIAINNNYIMCYMVAFSALTLPYSFCAVFLPSMCRIQTMVKIVSPLFHRVTVCIRK